MIERILKHMNIYKEMKNAAIPLKLIGKKGEDFCMNAARLVNQQELSGLMEGLNEETISSLMDDPEMLTYLGKMNKKDFSILEPDRIRMIVECAGNEKLSEFPYEKIEKVLADKEIPDRIVYVYLKYYAFLEPKEELKKQLVASLETCIGEFDVARAGFRILIPGTIICDHCDYFVPVFDPCCFFSRDKNIFGKFRIITDHKTEITI